MVSAVEYAWNPLVSLIVPAYNAAATIGETLDSLLAQTWTHLEVIVVDDGSTDETSSIVRAYAGRDARVLLLKQSNGGVARARNAGATAARGDFIGFIDADDLWRPDKVARQMQPFARGGDELVLVYSLWAGIDEESRILYVADIDAPEGDVLRPLCRTNFVGNCSSALIRKWAFASVGGFDPGLRDSGAQGCEDYKLFLALAERYRFAAVAEPLTGYRHTQENMSADRDRMYRSFLIVSEELERRRPDLSDDLSRGRTRYLQFLVTFGSARGRPGEFLRLASKLARDNPRAFAGTMLLRTRRTLSSLRQALRQGGARTTRARFLPR